jgi:hypothetical protein
MQIPVRIHAWDQDRFLNGAEVRSYNSGQHPLNGDTIVLYCEEDEVRFRHTFWTGSYVQRRTYCWEHHHHKDPIKRFLSEASDASIRAYAEEQEREQEREINRILAEEREEREREAKEAATQPQSTTIDWSRYWTATSDYQLYS